MLSRMNRIDVQPGDGILVPAGTAHAIGDGVFVAEVQEPTDFSILLEWSITTATREESHLGLGLPLALSATNHQAFTAQQLAGLVVHTDLNSTSANAQPLLPAGAEPFFRLDLLAPGAAGQPATSAGFAVAIGLSGEGELRSALDGDVRVRRGQVLAVPAGFGDWTLAGDVAVLCCRPGAGWPGTLADPSAPMEAVPR
jgi:mannose-6-phosphate isomerase